ncbi:hypothetical protein C8J57DRAFT_1270014 [Mycena rebaudengoi]|nr:hypothetical protein C8J57DRAFT_1270014 [Mycena rebaudengoi]
MASPETRNAYSAVESSNAVTVKLRQALALDERPKIFEAIAQRLRRLADSSFRLTLPMAEQPNAMTNYIDKIAFDSFSSYFGNHKHANSKQRLRCLENYIREYLVENGIADAKRSSDDPDASECGSSSDSESQSSRTPSNSLPSPSPSSSSKTPRPTRRSVRPIIEDSDGSDDQSPPARVFSYGGKVFSNRPTGPIQLGPIFPDTGEEDWNNDMDFSGADNDDDSNMDGPEDDASAPVPQAQPAAAVPATSDFEDTNDLDDEMGIGGGAAERSDDTPAPVLPPAASDDMDTSPDQAPQTAASSVHEPAPNQATPAPAPPSYAPTSPAPAQSTATAAPAQTVPVTVPMSAPAPALVQPSTAPVQPSTACAPPPTPNITPFSSFLPAAADPIVAFLAACQPSMAHLYTSFLRVGITEELQIQGLRAWGREGLGKFLSEYDVARTPLELETLLMAFLG